MTEPVFLWIWPKVDAKLNICWNSELKIISFAQLFSYAGDFTSFFISRQLRSGKNKKISSCGIRTNSMYPQKDIFILLRWILSQWKQQASVTKFSQGKSFEIYQIFLFVTVLMVFHMVGTAPNAVNAYSIKRSFT